MGERVKLQKVEVVGAKPLERPPDLRLGAFETPLVGLSCEKEIIAVSVHPAHPYRIPDIDCSAT
jgi:hypothetical protein